MRGAVVAEHMLHLPARWPWEAQFSAPSAGWGQSASRHLSAAAPPLQGFALLGHVVPARLRPPATTTGTPKSSANRESDAVGHDVAPRAGEPERGGARDG